MSLPVTHISDDALEPDDDGWFQARCTCGWSLGPLPDRETVLDALMEHAFGAGRAMTQNQPSATEGEAG